MEEWKSALDVLCDCRMPIKLKGKFRRTAIKSSILYVTKMLDGQKATHAKNECSGDDNASLYR